jgi:hypothetical protein
LKSIANMTPGELAAYIQSHLRAKGIEAVLTGGSAVSIYSQGKYVSKDLDFVVDGFAKRSKIRDAMEELGFQQIGRHFEHPEAEFLVEFPGGPLSVGKQPVRKIEAKEYETGTLKIISPTDCVKDRLAAYFYWNDRQSLEQASMISQECAIDLGEIAKWSENEGMLAAFKQIEGLLRKREA